jgi:hypothetical protein
VSPKLSGGAADFSAKPGAWVKPLRSAERTKPRFGFHAAKRPGNVTLSQRGKIWLAVVIYCAAVWSAGIWVWVDLYKGSGQ